MIRGKNIARFAAALIALLVAFSSCASKPKPPAPEPTPAPAPVTPTPAPSPAPAAPSVSQDELDKLLATAQELKQKAFDLKLFEVVPDDYKTAEAGYADAKAAYDARDSAKPDTFAAAKDKLDATIASYNDLIAKGVVDLATAKRQEAETMKATAVKAGADQAVPERFGPAEDAFSQAAALVDQGKHEDAIAAFEKARLYYELAYKRAVAGDLKKQIDDKDFAQWDSGNYQLADNKYQSEEGLWSSGDEQNRIAGLDALDEAVLRFNLVMQKGQETAVLQVKDKTDESRKRSDDIKAKVSAKDAYDAAVADYNAAVSDLATKDYEAAATGFDKASQGFDAAYATASEKRAAAEAAMKAADEATSESQRKAEEADSIVNRTSP